MRAFTCGTYHDVLTRYKRIKQVSPCKIDISKQIDGRFSQVKTFPPIKNLLVLLVARISDQTGYAMDSL
jgi:hypothetical protein